MQLPFNASISLQYWLLCTNYIERKEIRKQRRLWVEILVKSVCSSYGVVGKPKKIISLSSGENVPQGRICILLRNRQRKVEGLRRPVPPGSRSDGEREADDEELRARHL